jgi:outer membrane usher protein
VFFGLSYSFSRDGHSFYAGKDQESNAASFNWTSPRPNTASGPYGFASSRVGGHTREYTAGAGYWTHQGLAEAMQSRTRIESSGRSFDREETSLRTQGAIVFANGVLGLTPSVIENFAIVRGKEGLSGVDMKVDPDGKGGSGSRSSWVSPAVVANFGSYMMRELRVEPVDPPVGATPDRLTYAVMPTYKSGFLLELGKELKVIAVGRLLNSQREGLPNVPLEVRPVNDRAAAPIRTFTSRTGSFQIPELRPGRYEIAPAGPRPWNTLIVDIPRAADGVFRLGDLEVGP